jgi:hypothetical protein
MAVIELGVAPSGPQGPAGPAGTQDTFLHLFPTAGDEVTAASPNDTVNLLSDLNVNIVGDDSTKTITWSLGDDINIVGTVSSAVLEASVLVKFPSYDVAGVPSAATSGAGATIFVSNEIGGSVLAFSDGTNWRRCTDRQIISA